MGVLISVEAEILQKFEPDLQTDGQGAFNIAPSLTSGGIKRFKSKWWQDMINYPPTPTFTI